VAEPASVRGLATLAGSSPSVGIAGYTLHGGLGWLARRHGLACNSLVSADVVTADGRKLRVDREVEPDLFWALRGGGGGFAAVTALEFALYPAPELFGGVALWPWERGAEVLRRWRDWVAGVPDEVTSVGRLLQVPPLPVAPEPLRGRAFVGVEAAFLGPQAEGERLVAPLRELGPELDTFATIAPAGLAALHMDPPEPVPGTGGHVMLAELPDAALDALVDVAGPGSGSPLVSVELRQLGGALAEAAPGAGALARLDGAFALYGVGIAALPEQALAAEAQHAKIARALEPWTGGRRYLNFVEQPIDPAEGFEPDTFARLREVKAKHDPGNLFRGNHPIAPS
jgi:FAD binding domain/Berberine and berberine like